MNLMVFDPSTVWSLTVLKSPPITVTESGISLSEEKNVWKKDGSSMFGCKHLLL